MLIREIDHSVQQEYCELVLQTGTVFNDLSWKSIYKDRIRYYGIFNAGDKLIGGFSLYHEKKFGFSVCRNPKYTPESGPFLKADAQSITSKLDVWKEVMSLIANFIDDLKFSIISISLPTSIIDTQPFIWKKFKVNPGYTYIVDLTKTSDDLWKNMSKKHRHDVNKAIKDGIHSRKIEDYHVVKELCKKTFVRQRRSIEESYIDKLLFEFATPKNSYAFASYDGDVPIAATFFLCDRLTSYALLGGYDHRNRHHGAGTLTDWEGIKHAKDIGLKFFDFEGSMVPPIERYMRGFGGQLTPYFRVNKATLPLEIILKLFKRELF